MINLLAIDNGGTDIDPTNYAPLFANIIKLELVPEKGVFIIEDLSKMVDLQSQISDLPTEKIIEIAKEYHHNQIMNLPEEEISLNLSRNFQHAKLELQSDLEDKEKQAFFEKKEKEKYIHISEKATQKLRETYTGQLRDKYDKKLRNNRLRYFLYLPILSLIITYSIVYIKNSSLTIWKDDLVAFLIHLIVWVLTDFLFVRKQLNSKYSERIIGINNEVEQMIKHQLSE